LPSSMKYEGFRLCRLKMPPSRGRAELALVMLLLLLLLVVLVLGLVGRRRRRRVVIIDRWPLLGLPLHLRLLCLLGLLLLLPAYLNPNSNNDSNKGRISSNNNSNNGSSRSGCRS